MNKYLKRLLKREKAIKNWLEKNHFEQFLHKADQILESLPREAIKKEYEEGIQEALKHCSENNEIRALDFQWYYAGREIGKALAYGLDSCSGKGNLSKSDLGPEDLPGIEAKLDHGILVDEYFAQIPVNYAINRMVEEMMQDLNQSGHQDRKYVVTDYFQIWNYKIGSEVCEALQDSEMVLKLKDRAPFWITMSVQGRSPIAIMSVD